MPKHRSRAPSPEIIEGVDDIDEDPDLTYAAGNTGDDKALQDRLSSVPETTEAINKESKSNGKPQYKPRKKQKTTTEPTRPTDVKPTEDTTPKTATMTMTMRTRRTKKKPGREIYSDEQPKDFQGVMLDWCLCEDVEYSSVGGGVEGEEFLIETRFIPPRLHKVVAMSEQKARGSKVSKKLQPP